MVTPWSPRQLADASMSPVRGWPLVHLAVVRRVASAVSLFATAYKRVVTNEALLVWPAVSIVDSSNATS